MRWDKINFISENIFGRRGRGRGRDEGRDGEEGTGGKEGEGGMGAGVGRMGE